MNVSDEKSTQANIANQRITTLVLISSMKFGNINYQSQSLNHQEALDVNHDYMLSLLRSNVSLGS